VEDASGACYYSNIASDRICAEPESLSDVAGNFVTMSAEAGFRGSHHPVRHGSDSSTSTFVNSSPSSTQDNIGTPDTDVSPQMGWEVSCTSNTNSINSATRLMQEQYSHPGNPAVFPIMAREGGLEWSAASAMQYGASGRRTHEGATLAWRPVASRAELPSRAPRNECYCQHNGCGRFGSREAIRKHVARDHIPPGTAVEYYVCKTCDNRGGPLTLFKGKRKGGIPGHYRRLRRPDNFTGRNGHIARLHRSAEEKKIGQEVDEEMIATHGVRVHIVEIAEGVLMTEDGAEDVLIVQ